MSEQRATVLVIDDEMGTRESLRMILETSHRVLCARDGQEGLQLLRSQPVDLVTLDLSMPGLSGEELMRIMRREFPATELIIVTGYGTLENAAEAVRYGVSDYLQKPFDMVQVSAAVYRALLRRRGRNRLAAFLQSLGEVVGFDDQAQKVLEQADSDPRVNRQVGDLITRFDEGDPDAGVTRTLDFLEVLAQTVESQASFMRGHAQRTAFYAGVLAERLSLNELERQNVRIAAFLHDIGKIGVPTELLLRPAGLDSRERALVERHPGLGAGLVEPLGMASEITAGIRHHHEWWDGRGYGSGLHGENIPLPARIIGLVDAYDAMSCNRPYRSALPPETTRMEIERYAGVQFDPTLAKEFLLILEASEVDLQLLAETRPDVVGATGARARAELRPEALAS